jgi:signal transduction histidine kinase
VPELILGDSTRIRQIVANLVANAIKFTPTGGVHIHLGLDGEAPGDAHGDRGMRVRIQIADSGVGIDPARLPSCSSPSSRPTRASAAASAAPAWACRSPTTWRS